MGNVLIDYNPRKVINQRFSDPAIQELLFREIFQSQGWKDLDQGLITFEDHFQTLSARLPEYDNDIRWLLDNWHTDQPVLPGIYDLVHQIKQAGFGLYVLSNASDRFQAYASKITIFQLFDAITISSELKLIKPQPEIYGRFCQIHGLSPEENLFIDDTKGNVDAAIAAGWQAYQYINTPLLTQYLNQTLQTSFKVAGDKSA